MTSILYLRKFNFQQPCHIFEDGPDALLDPWYEELQEFQEFDKEAEVYVII